MPLANPSGTATWSIAVPAQPALLGGTLFAQGFVVDPTAYPLGVVASNAREAIVGSQ